MKFAFIAKVLSLGWEARTKMPELTKLTVEAARIQ
jgi:hypothetical protein